ncbi:MAG: hypothetical protein ACI9SP_000728 [Arenicella sp.]|jgi:hypothetical protein
MSTDNPNYPNEQTVQQDQQPQKQQSKGRNPDHIAYNVKETREGKPIFNRIGAAWQHKDGQGFDIQLDSTPVNGRVTMRELHDQQMQRFDQQQHAMNEAPQQEQSHQPEKANEHSR